MLDAVNYYDQIAENSPEELLEFSDWMGIPLEPYTVTPERLMGLLTAEVTSQEQLQVEQR